MKKKKDPSPPRKVDYGKFTDVKIAERLKLAELCSSARDMDLDMIL